MGCISSKILGKYESPGHNFQRSNMIEEIRDHLVPAPGAMATSSSLPMARAAAWAGRGTTAPGPSQETTAGGRHAQWRRSEASGQRKGGVRCGGARPAGEYRARQNKTI